MKTASTIRESDIQKVILEYLHAIQIGYFWRNNNGGVYDPKKKIFRSNKSVFTPKGIADILGVYQGRFVAIEVKRAKCYPTKEQKLFLMNITDNGGIAFIARSIEDVNRGLKLGKYHD